VCSAVQEPGIPVPDYMGREGTHTMFPEEERELGRRRVDSEGIRCPHFQYLDTKEAF
jgi:hypothetical protein